MSSNPSVPDGLGVRIPGFHPGGPGSIPGLGAFFKNPTSCRLHVIQILGDGFYQLNSTDEYLGNSVYANDICADFNILINKVYDFEFIKRRLRSYSSENLEK